MNLPRGYYFNIGPRLTLILAILITLILGGNGLILWQFRITRIQTERLTGVSQQQVAVLRLQEAILLFHQHLDELAQSEDANHLIAESGPVLETLLGEIKQAQNTLASLPSETLVDPAILPTLEAIHITLPSQLNVIRELAVSGSWKAVRLRLANELKPLEAQTSDLVTNIDREVSLEHAQAVVTMKDVQLGVLIIVPVTATSTIFIATFLGWAISRRIIDLRLEERVSERTRLAREFHDTLLQTIQACKMLADDALEKVTDPPGMRLAIKRLSNWLGRATEEGRAALDSLRASEVQRNDLLEAIRRTTEEFTNRESLKVTFGVTGSTKEMLPLLQEEIYRIGCEAIRNACVHSEAGHLDVQLRYSEDFVLSVTDNGKGIPTEIVDKGRQGHFGLRGMRERAARIGGKLSIETSPSSGTHIMLQIPGGTLFHQTGLSKPGRRTRKPPR